MHLKSDIYIGKNGSIHVKFTNILLMHAREIAESRSKIFLNFKITESILFKFLKRLKCTYLCASSLMIVRSRNFHE